MRVDFLQGYDLVYFAILAGQQAAVTSTVCQSVPPTAKEAGSTIKVHEVCFYSPLCLSHMLRESNANH